MNNLTPHIQFQSLSDLDCTKDDPTGWGHSAQPSTREAFKGSGKQKGKQYKIKGQFCTNSI
jgi:hypothetical protein